MNDRGLKITLAVSLVVNFLVLGVVIGVLITRPPPPGAGPGRGIPMLGVGGLLNPADREAFRTAMLAKAFSLAPVIEDDRAARREATRLLKAEPFDRAAAAAALARARTDDENLRGQFEDTVLDFAAKLDPVERAALAAGIQRRAAARWMARR